MNLIKELYIDCFFEGFPGIVIGVFVWIATLLLFLLLYIGVIKFYDYSFLESSSGVFQVESKEYHEPYITTQIIPSGKIMVPIIINHDEEFILNFKNEEGKFDDFCVSEDFYSKVKTKDKFLCEYKAGRFSGGVWIVGIKQEVE